MAKKKLGGRGCRQKGHAFERYVAKEFRKIFPNAKRHLEYQGSEAIGVDLDNTGEFKVQCKRNRNYAPITKIEEVKLCPIEGGIPVLVTKGDNKEPMACLPFKDFLRIVKNQK